jgi:hypothetical protein
MRRNPERLAWTVTLGAFITFCVCAVSLPLGIRWYLTSATKAQEARVTCLEGTAVVEDPVRGTARPILRGETISAPEGSVISVDESAQAVLTFFDQSLVKLYPSTSVSLERMRVPRYRFGSRPAQILLHVRGGRLFANTVLRGTSSVNFQVHTLQADTLLAEDGGYNLEVSNERTEIIVQRGTAEVSTGSAGGTATPAPVVLNSRQRTVVENGAQPLAPMKAERDLLTNGDFKAPLATGWSSYNDQGGDGGNVDGQVSLTVDEGRRAVRFARTGGESNHCETIIEQELNRDLPDPITTLKIRATVKLVNQSLSGGGYLSSEYPLMIRIRYRDAYLSENEWVHGFYYQNPNNTPTQDGQEIPQNTWFFYESENLLEKLPISPRRIVWIRIYASGWNYESLISEISLVVE